MHALIDISNQMLEDSAFDHAGASLRKAGLAVAALQPTHASLSRNMLLGDPHFVAYERPVFLQPVVERLAQGP
jgi:hypothetical protein